MEKFRRLLVTASMSALAVFVMAGAALAQDPAEVTAANTAISSAVDSATSILTTAIPLVLGVTAVWVALKFGGRLIKKVGGS